MLPRLQFKVRQEEVTSVNKLIELAGEAEAQLEVSYIVVYNARGGLSEPLHVCETTTVS